MKTFKNMAAQGDFIILRITSLPENIEPFTEIDDGKYVIAHSETGHNHVMVMDRVKAYKPSGVESKDIFELYLSVEDPTTIEHLRSFDTHEALQVPAGNYVVKRQREYVPEGFRKAAD